LTKLSTSSNTRSFQLIWLTESLEVSDGWVAALVVAVDLLPVLLVGLLLLLGLGLVLGSGLVWAREWREYLQQVRQVLLQARLALVLGGALVQASD